MLTGFFYFSLIEAKVPRIICFKSVGAITICKPLFPADIRIVSNSSALLSIKVGNNF
ncbi:conserved hypothetical protein, partial [Listeria seeligeri FSL S4-171]